MKETSLEKLHKIHRNLKRAWNSLHKEWDAFQWEERWLECLVGDVWAGIDESLKLLEQILNEEQKNKDSQRGEEQL